MSALSEGTIEDTEDLTGESRRFDAQARTIYGDFDALRVQLRFLARSMQTGPFGSQLSASEYIEGGVPVINPANLRGGRIAPDPSCSLTTETAERLSRHRLKSGDLVFGRRGELGRCAIVGEAEENWICGTGSIRVRPRTEAVDPRFLHWAVSTRVAADWLSAQSVGSTMDNLNTSILGRLPIWCPPLSVQRAIADYLDEKTAAIDALIAKRERQALLLAEKRKTAIYDRLTIGLGGGALVSSGHDWLGTVPDHWAIVRLKFALRSIEQGWSPSCENRPAEEDEWGVMKAGCVNGMDFDQEDNKALPADVEPLIQYEIRAGDVLMSRANTRALLGSAAYVRQVRPRLLLCDKLYRLNPRPEAMDAEFLAHALSTSSARYQFEREATGSSASMQNIGQDTVKNLILPLPPLHEQRAIIVDLKQELNHLERMRGALTSSIEKLREYRQTLISAAVTGQIPIREEVPA